jgi:hypothetical protein
MMNAAAAAAVVVVVMVGQRRMVDSYLYSYLIFGGAERWGGGGLKTVLYIYSRANRSAVLSSMSFNRMCITAYTE